MSFTLTSVGSPWTWLDLKAGVNMTVPSTSWGVVPHDEVLLSIQPGCLLWVIRTPRPALDLLVDTYCILQPNEPLVTRVFNLSTKPVRIKAGTVLSRLVSVRLE